ncbi:Hypothetical ATP-dependent helicase HrpB [Moritella viscosa]|nr:Hypothetical ATP-dependent helicase HrpB [Moritella viscosa]SHO21421.1 Hypothetical ATP-dependent helicase HrpB [Moritella viscosa]
MIFYIYSEVSMFYQFNSASHYWPDNPLEAMPTRRVKKHM